ncbi:MAG: helix-hairpin-helix domain-containing protein [Pyrinomonadaceae bacterium]
MTKTHKPFIYLIYRFHYVLFLSVFIVLTFGCGVQSNVASDAKSEAFKASANAVNINTATAEELEKIPFIGEKLARDIIEHRGINGPFRKPEHLMLIQGISDRRFREIRGLIRTE